MNEDHVIRTYRISRDGVTLTFSRGLICVILYLKLCCQNPETFTGLIITGLLEPVKPPYLYLYMQSLMSKDTQSWDLCLSEMIRILDFHTDYAEPFNC